MLSVTGNRRLVLVSFADSRYRNALKRLEEMTRPFPFTERHFLTEKDVPRSKWRKWKPWLYRRGYGYWAWKPYVIRRQLEQLEDGDILFWSDCGICWNATEIALKRFYDYISFLTAETPVLAFEESSPEWQYTKMDCLTACGVKDSLRYSVLESPQLWSGCIGLRKTSDVMTLIMKFESLCDKEKEIVTDKNSQEPNYDGFIEHRHDQSIFSCLVKQTSFCKIANDEIGVRLPHIKDFQDYPIQARRTKEIGRPWGVRIKNKLLRPWRMVLNVYFRRIRGYHFECPFYPW